MRKISRSVLAHVLSLVSLTALAAACTSSSETGNGGEGTGGDGGSATPGMGGTGGGAASGTGGNPNSGGAAATGGNAGIGGTVGTGGEGNNPALDEKCTPTFTLDMDDAGPNGPIFLDAVGDDPEGYVQEIGRNVCRILYRTPEEVRDVNHITLIIEDSDGVAWKAGDVGDIMVGISANHLKNVQDDGRDVGAEISGVLFHEMTHMYQHDDKPEATFPQIANMYEGIADAVRIRAGYTPSGAQPNQKSGEWYDKTYTGQAFFWLFIDNAHEDFLHDLNLSMIADDIPWQPSAIQEITGKSVDVHWDDYVESTCCDGGNTACCN